MDKSLWRNRNRHLIALGAAIFLIYGWRPAASGDTSENRHLTYIYSVGASKYSGDSEGVINGYVLRSTGVVEPLTPPRVVTADNPVCAVSDARGRYLFVGSSNVLSYRVGLKGQLTLIQTVNVGKHYPASMAVSPDDRYLYVCLAYADKILQFAIKENGRLDPINPSSVAVEHNPTSLAITDDGFAYVTSSSEVLLPGEYGSVWRYRISPTGSLTSCVAAIEPEKSDRYEYPTQFQIVPGKKVAYMDTGNGIRGFKISSAGTLEDVGDLQLPQLFADPMPIYVDPLGRFLYKYGTGQYAVALIGSDGRFTSSTKGTISYDDQPAAASKEKRYPFAMCGMAVDPSGKWAFVRGLSSVLECQVGPLGALTPVRSLSAEQVISDTPLVVVSK